MAFQPGTVSNQYNRPSGPTSSGFQPGSASSAFGGGGLGRSGVDNSQQLYNLAVKNGLGADADRILAKQQGESPTKIFSGGFITDIFDGLNALQYGITGLLKGKTFLDGVKTRQSFSDKDALGEFGIPGVVGGIAMDIAVDPLTYFSFGISGAVKAVSKATGLTKLAKLGKGAVFGSKAYRGVDSGKLYKTFKEAESSGERIAEVVEGGTKIGRMTADKLVYAYGRDPTFMKYWERASKNTALTIQKAAELAKPIAKITPKTAKKLFTIIDDQGRLGRASLDSIKNSVTPDQFQAVSKLYQKIDNLGAEAVKEGLIDIKTYEANLGKYLKNAYEEFETAKKTAFGFRSAKIGGIKSRVEKLSPDRIADRIKNPAYLYMKSIVDLTRDVENAKLFRKVADNFGRPDAATGFSKMSNDPGLGKLAGLHVPDAMKEWINLLNDPVKFKLAKQITADFKFYKVVMNPSTHVRNIMSNQVLNYWKLGMIPGDPRTIRAQTKALKEIAKKGGRYTEEAQPLGYNINTFAAAELKTLLNAPEMSKATTKMGKQWQTVKKALGDLYQGEENFAKLSAYIYQREVKNLSPEEAWKFAEAATFNYAQITPFIQKLRTAMFGMPFITFTYKATPLAIETALTNPQRIGVIGKIKEGIENQADIEVTERERAAEPPWVRDGFFVKLPGEDSEGRSMYFDMTYILPFGDLVAGNFFQRGTDRETGTAEGVPGAAASKFPAFQLLSDLFQNENFYGRKIWRSSDPIEKQLQDMFIHILKTYGPPLAAEQLHSGYDNKGERVYRGFVGQPEEDEEVRDQRRTTTQELFRHVGLKVQPVDVDIQEDYSEWNKKRALTTLLKESGVVGDLTIPYVRDQENDE